MTKRAEDLVAQWEKTGVATVNLDELKALCASWHEMREALTRIRDNDPDSWEAFVARAALKDEP